MTRKEEQASVRSHVIREHGRFPGGCFFSIKCTQPTARSLFSGREFCFPLFQTRSLISFQRNCRLQNCFKVHSIQIGSKGMSGTQEFHMLPSSMASMVPVSSSSRIPQCRRVPVPVFHDTPDVGAMAEPLEPRVERNNQCRHFAGAK